MSAAYPDTFIMNRAMREAQMTSASDDRIWKSYDSGLEELDRCLGPALRAVGFQSLAHAMKWLEKIRDRQPSGLEIAGQGKTFSQERVPGIANCLAVPEFLIDQPQRTSRPRRRYANPPVTFVPGDIAERETWDDIQAAIQGELSDPPNLILFTPADGTSCMPETPEFYESVLARSLELADPGPVVMVGEMNSHFSVRLEQRLLAMQHRGEAQVAILSGYEYGLFALVRP